VPDADDALATWSRLGADLRPSAIRVVLVDIDGVISGGEGAPFDLAVLERLAAWNDAGLRDPSVPAIALCTGRQAPYVELLAQLIHAFLPCLYEHGAGLLEPRAFRFTFNPVLGPAPWRTVARIREILDEPLLAPGRAFVQPGKEATLTLYPVGGSTVAEVAVLARAALAEGGVDFRVTANIRGVEVRPPGIDKGAGARWLAEELGIRLEQFAGVGDADDDLAFLELVGFAATPANGSAEVRAMARYVAAKPFGDGLLEILDHLAAVNRSN
jgi:haloacid dehalogenase-like hydrolase